MVDEVVVQEREVIVERRGPAAGLGGCVFGRELPVVGEAVKDLVIVGLGLPARSGTVPEYHFFAGVVAQTQICNVEVDLFEHAALSPPGTSPRLLPPLPSSGSFVTRLARPRLLSSLPSPAARAPPSPAAAACGWGGGGGGGGRGGEHGG